MTERPNTQQFNLFQNEKILSIFRNISEHKLLIIYVKRNKLDVTRLSGKGQITSQVISEYSRSNATR